MLAALLLASAASIATSKAYSTVLDAEASAADASPEVAFEVFANAAALAQTEESALELYFETDGSSGAPPDGVLVEWGERRERVPFGERSLYIEGWHADCAVDGMGDCQRVLRVLGSQPYDLEVRAFLIDPAETEAERTPYPADARLEIRRLE